MLEMDCMESVQSKMDDIQPASRSFLKLDDNNEQVQLNMKINSPTGMVEVNSNSNGNENFALSKLSENVLSSSLIQISNTILKKRQPSASSSTAVNYNLPETVETTLADSNQSLIVSNQNRSTDSSQVSKVSISVQIPSEPSDELPSLVLDNWSEKLSAKFKSIIEESLQDLAEEEDIEAKIKMIELEMFEMKKQHKQKMIELQYKHNIILMETRRLYEEQIRQAVIETKSKCDEEINEMVISTKKKRWCAVCKNEAKFYCCSSTAYCNYQCQQTHWPDHMEHCDYDNRPVTPRRNRSRKNR